MSRSEIFKANAPESAVAESLKTNPGRLAGRITQEDLDASLANGQFGGDVKEIHRASNETSIRESNQPGNRGGAAFNYPASPGTTSTNIPINVVLPPRWKAAGFNSQEEHDKELHELYSTELTKEVGQRASQLQADAAEDAETEKLAKRAAASKPKEEVAQTSNTVLGPGSRVLKPLPEADLYADERKRKFGTTSSPEVESDDDDIDVEIDDSMSSEDLLDPDESPIILKPRPVDNLPRFPHEREKATGGQAEPSPIEETKARAREMELARRAREDAALAASSKASRDAFLNRKKDEAAKAKESQTDASETTQERDEARMDWVSGKRTYDNPSGKAAPIADPVMVKNIDKASKSGEFLRQANEVEPLDNDPNVAKAKAELGTPPNEPNWKRAGFSSAEEHASELEGLYRKEFPGSSNVSPRQRAIDIDNQERRWPTDLDVDLRDNPLPSAPQRTVVTKEGETVTEVSPNYGPGLTRPATASSEEALTIARTKGGEGSAATVEQDASREKLKAERDAYETSRQEELMRDHKNKDGSWKDTAGAHEDETKARLKEYEKKITSVKSKKSRIVTGQTKDIVKQSDRVPTGNTEAALQGLMSDFNIAHESGDVMGRERARRAYHNVGVDEGYHAHIDAPCATANCGNIVKGESQIAEATFKPVPGRTLGLGKNETEFRQTGVTGGDDEGTVCKDCAAKGL